MWRYTPVSNSWDMTGVTFTISTCSGYGVNYKNCKVISASTTPAEMPSFPIAVEEEALNVKSAKVAFVSESSGGECKAKNTKFSFPSVIAKVNNPAGIETLTLFGKGSAESELGANEASTSGTLSVVGTNSGTYGIR